MLTVQSDNIGASAWMDRKVVRVMYAGWDPAECTDVLRRQKDGTRSLVPCPAACAAYNKYMGGVDRGDQLRGYYHFKQKTHKFYKYIANFLLGVGLTNAFIIFKASHLSARKYGKQFGSKMISLGYTIIT